MRLRLTLFLLSCFTPALSLAATELIPLQHRLAEELLPSAQAIIGPHGRVNAYGNQLIVNAPSQNIAELRQLLQELDLPARQYWVSIDFDGQASEQNDQIGASGELHYPGRNKLNAHLQQQQGQQQQQAQQRIQVTEGYPSLIRSAQSRPVIVTQDNSYSRHYSHTVIQEAQQGTYITVQRAGRQVQVTLSSSFEQLNPNGSISQQQSTDTRVTATLGQWIELGGIQQDSAHQQADTLMRDQNSYTENSILRIKIDAIDE